MTKEKSKFTAFAGVLLFLTLLMTGFNLVHTECIKVQSLENQTYTRQVDSQTQKTKVVKIQELIQELITTKIKNENTDNTESMYFTSIDYTDEDLEILSRVINGEAGSDWITDEHQLAVGSVVLNRMASPRFKGDTIKEIVFQNNPIQYACTVDGNYYKEPSERAINNARYLLENGSTIPENVIWQSQEIQGNGLWKKIQNHYFCY